ncbi:Peptidase family C25 [Thermoplasmatales archaeon SCGC AB-539-C06]|nr:Peptidase family C25 [Thermoplasmatales archaeon SCGC AB-539-C06]
MLMFKNRNLLVKKSSSNIQRKLGVSNTKKYDLLVITPMHFVTSLYKFASHKKWCGIETKIVSLKDIYNGCYFQVKGKNLPETIKYFIKDALEKWNISYVLLVGGSKQIPVRYVHNIASDPSIDFQEPKFISDLYYADIYDSKGNFSSWDTNGNGLYGEWKGKTAEDKNIDLRPDVCIGRLPCRNRLEIKIMVNKIISYERNTYGKPWFKRMVSVAGDTYQNNDGIYEGEVDVQKVINYMKDFNHKKIWTSQGEQKSRFSVKIIRSVNQGCGFLVFAGHGNPIFWSTHPPDDNKHIFKFSMHHMQFLYNRGMLPVCIVSGCRNSAFDTTIVNLFRNPKISLNKLFNYLPRCWSWALTSKISGGSIVTIGSTALVYLKWDKETGGETDGWSFLLPRFFYEYTICETNIIGELWRNTIIGYLKKFPIDWNTPSLSYDTSSPKPNAINARTVQSCILLGDPSLKIGGYNIESFE